HAFPTRRSSDLRLPSLFQVLGMRSLAPMALARRRICRRTFLRCAEVLGRVRPTARIALWRSDRFLIGKDPTDIAAPDFAKRSLSSEENSVIAPWPPHPAYLPGHFHLDPAGLPPFQAGEVPSGLRGTGS